MKMDKWLRHPVGDALRMNWGFACKSKLIESLAVLTCIQPPIRVVHHE